MRIVVSDSSCLIDLRKASLLDALVRLPYELLIPNTLFEDELLKFTAAQKRALLHGGLQVIDLPGDRVTRAVEVSREVPRLSIHDGFAFSLAEQHEGCVLLTRSCPSRPYSTRSRCSPPTRPSGSQRAKSRHTSGGIRRCANLEWVGLVSSGQRRPKRPLPPKPVAALADASGCNQSHSGARRHSVGQPLTPQTATKRQPMAKRHLDRRLCAWRA